jgi:hypothetical protein
MAPSLWQSAQDFPAAPALAFHNASPSSTHSMPGLAVSSFWIAWVSGAMKLKPERR